MAIYISTPRPPIQKQKKPSTTLHTTHTHTAMIFSFWIFDRHSEYCGSDSMAKHRNGDTQTKVVDHPPESFSWFPRQFVNSSQTQVRWKLFAVLIPMTLVV